MRDVMAHLSRHLAPGKWWREIGSTGDLVCFDWERAWRKAGLNVIQPGRSLCVTGVVTSSAAVWRESEMSHVRLGLRLPT